MTNINILKLNVMGQSVRDNGNKANFKIANRSFNILTLPLLLIQPKFQWEQRFEWSYEGSRRFVHLKIVNSKIYSFYQFFFVIPFRIFIGPYFWRQAISPGISFSAKIISLRPQSANEISAEKQKKDWVIKFVQNFCWLVSRSY